MTELEPTGAATWAEWLDADAWARWLSAGVDVGLGPWLADATGWRPRPDLPVIDDPDAFVQARQAQNLADGVWPDAVERLVRHSSDKAPWSMAFLHGFGATRAGGEAVLDPLAQSQGANLYYDLLPGHGRTPDAHAAATAEQYLASAAETLAIARGLGHKVCLVGSSTGGLLATWLAAEFPEHVDAVVLASPFFAFRDSNALVFRLPFGIDAIEWAVGPDRDARMVHPRRVDGYDQHWLTEQRIRALAHLERLRGWLARDGVYSRVKAPVLMLYHPDDDTVSVDAMHYAFGRMPPHPLSRFVPIVDGNHILLSEYVQTDKPAINAALHAFFGELTRRS
ncbi:MAG: alpha/beta hydrolase [Myxococcota bacterium]